MAAAALAAGGLPTHLAVGLGGNTRQLPALEGVMGMFHRKAAASDIYTFAGVGKDNPLAVRIQHHVDLLRYLAGHPRLTKKDLAGYMDMTERYGMGDKASDDKLLAAYRPENQAARLRPGLAEVSLDALRDCMRTLGETERPTAETLRMLKFAVDEPEKLKSAFGVLAGALAAS
jgi:hypothetical protein